MEFNKNEYKDNFLKEISEKFGALKKFYNAIDHEFVFDEYEFEDNEKSIRKLVKDFGLVLKFDSNFGFWTVEDNFYNMQVYGAPSRLGDD